MSEQTVARAAAFQLARGCQSAHGRDGSYGEAFIRRLRAMGIRDRLIMPSARPPFRRSCNRCNLTVELPSGDVPKSPCLSRSACAVGRLAL
jgi:hypothetical protein